MTEREKVINGLEEVIAEAVYPDRPRKFMMPLELAEDALALLRSEASVQEPVEPTISGDADGPCGNWWYQCGKCKEAIDYHDKYCRNCGQAVKWE